MGTGRRATLSQTLPAPGEVERLRDLYAVHEAWPVDKHPRNGAPTEEWEPYFAANRARKELLDAIPALFATVAAANDEGVFVEQVARLVHPDNWHWHDRFMAEADDAEDDSRANELRLEANRQVAKSLATSRKIIRLLSQGEGN